MTNVSPSRRAAVAALVVALVLALAGTTVAVTGGGDRRGSAASGSVTETRVRAFEAVTANVDRADGSVLAGQGRAATTPAAQEMVGSRVAPNTPGRGADFVAGPIGSAPPVPVSQSRMAAGFDAAGFPRTPTASTGMEYVLPDGSLVRLMQPSGSAPLRASFTNAIGGPINPFTGKPVQPPAPPGWSMKDWVRALTHVEQTP